MPEPAIRANTHEEWLAHVQPTGLVVAAKVLDERISAPVGQTAVDTARVVEATTLVDGLRGLTDPWGFFQSVLGWEARLVAGAPGGPPLPDQALALLPEHHVTLCPDWVVLDKDGDPADPAAWRLFVTFCPQGSSPDSRGAHDDWEATPAQRMERLLRETEVPAGLVVASGVLRLISAPRGESSGWIDFPIAGLAEVAGRPMLAGLKALLGPFSLMAPARGQSLADLISESRRAQANVSIELAGQVLGALHALLHGFSAQHAMPLKMRAMAADPGQAHHLYEGLLTVLMRLVFLLYAEDRDLIPSRREGAALELYDQNYSVRGLLQKLEEDEARYPATMGDRFGGWGRLLALFRLVYAGDRYGWIQARSGKLFDPDEFPFLEARGGRDAPPAVPRVSDATVLEVLRLLMRLGGNRLSYRTLDVEQIGSVYETVMGFTVQAATGPSLAIRAGKKNHTPVFVDLSALLETKLGDRLAWLKDRTDRGKFPPAIEAAIKTAVNIEALAAAFEAGGRGVVDERGSPQRRIAEAGTPLLQPTDERRRTGSHYTPRALTEPIVRHALEPAFGRLGPDANAGDVLALKVCDPAMGSGAFLVEACRQLGARLEGAWRRWPEEKPPIPSDEDETLHARRLVAQQCLYGVDRNPMATDLARLSLWLATLARDHEFTFLDHALKSGDSLVGLTNRQITSLAWDDDPHATLDFAAVVVRGRLEKAERARDQIRFADDLVTVAELQRINRDAEVAITDVRLIGDAIVAAFFSADSNRTRKARLEKVNEALHAGRDHYQDALRALAVPLGRSARAIRPFHWEIEFPEVFDRANPGFDAIVGNPPFAGKNTLAASERPEYPDWLQEYHVRSHGNSDLVAHFFRRAHYLTRDGGCFGMIASNTLAQGDTRKTGLEFILGAESTIIRAQRRLVWPGDAAVVVCVVHIAKAILHDGAVLDGNSVERISAFLGRGALDKPPVNLKINNYLAFNGSLLLGMGFVLSSEEFNALTAEEKQAVAPYIGGQELNGLPNVTPVRYVINLNSLSLEESERRFPSLVELLRQRVKPIRDTDPRPHRRERWWQFGDPQRGLLDRLALAQHVCVRSLTSVHAQSVVRVPAAAIFDQTIVVFLLENYGGFGVLASRAHECWSSTFGSSLEDRPRYNVDDCLKTFPFAEGFETDVALEAASRTYHEHRAALMVAADEGLTKTYNRFHDPDEKRPAILELRRLHEAMDHAMLAAYGWSDLVPLTATEFEPLFAEEDDEEAGARKSKRKYRLRWPEPVRDEVLARLLALNGERARAEAAAAPTRTIRRRAATTGMAEAGTPGLFDD